MDKLIPEITEYCKSKFPEEACGVVILFKGRYKFIPCENVTLEDKTEYFAIHPLVYASICDRGQVCAIVHSHTKIGAVFSEHDIASQRMLGIPWLLIGLGGGVEEHAWLSNKKQVFDLYGREYQWHVSDCFTFVQDWYEREMGIIIKDVQRQDKFWESGQELYLDNFISAGFVEVPKTSMKVGDALLLQLAGSVTSHAAIYLGNNLIGHHLNGRLSSKDVLGQYYLDRITKVVRHGSLL